MKKGQFAFEFAIVMAFALLFVGVFITIFQDHQQDVALQNERTNAERVYNVFLNEVTLAEQSPSRYEREFYLPQSIDGRDYNITLQDRRDFIVTIDTREHVFFLPTGVDNESLLERGSTTIVKECSSGSCDIFLED